MGIASAGHMMTDSLPHHHLGICSFQDDEREDQPRKRRSEPLRAAQEAHAAALAAAAAAVPPLQHCTLCQTSFTSAAELQQHLAGPVHRKAEQRAAQEAAQRAAARGGQFSALAADALQAAAWSDSRSAAALGPRSGGGGGGGRNGAGDAGRGGGRGGGRSGQRQRPQQAAAPAARRDETFTHEQVLAAARKDGPLSLDGVCVCVCAWLAPSPPPSHLSQTPRSHSPALSCYHPHVPVQCCTWTILAGCVPDIYLSIFCCCYSTAWTGKHHCWHTVFPPLLLLLLPRRVGAPNGATASTICWGAITDSTIQLPTRRSPAGAADNS